LKHKIFLYLLNIFLKRFFLRGGLLILCGGCSHKPDPIYIDPLYLNTREVRGPKGTVSCVLKPHWIKKLDTQYPFHKNLFPWSLPCSGGGCLFFIGRGQTLFALEEKTGHILWKKQLSPFEEKSLSFINRAFHGPEHPHLRIGGSLIWDDQYQCLWTVDALGTIRVWNIKGILLGSYDLKESVRDPLCLGNNAVFIQTLQDKIYAFHRSMPVRGIWSYANTDTSTWRLFHPRGMALKDSWLIIPDSKGHIKILSQASGKELDQYPLISPEYEDLSHVMKRSFWESVNTVNHIPVILGSQIFFQIYNKGMFALNLISRELDWKVNVTKTHLGPVITPKGLLMYQRPTNVLVLRNIHTGDRLGTWLLADIPQDLFLVGKTAWIRTHNILWPFKDTELGSPIKLQMPSKSSSKIAWSQFFPHNNLLVISDIHGVVYAYNFLKK
jgi:hypothetical protein